MAKEKKMSSYDEFGGYLRDDKKGRDSWKVFVKEIFYDYKLEKQFSRKAQKWMKRHSNKEDFVVKVFSEFFKMMMDDVADGDRFVFPRSKSAYIQKRQMQKEHVKRLIDFGLVDMDELLETNFKLNMVAFTDRKKTFSIHSDKKTNKRINKILKF